MKRGPITLAVHYHRLGAPPAAVHHSILAIPWQFRDLISILTWREIAGRYRGSLLGSLWPLLNPLIMLGLYTSVFGVILQSRWPGSEDQGMGAFALRLLSGMLVHGLLAEVLGRAPSLVTSQPNYVTKVVFPLEVLAWVNLLTALFHAGLALAVMLLINGLFGSGFAWAQLALPVLLLPFCMILLGASWFLAALGVYVRDMNQLIGPLVTIMMFLAPLFYPRSVMPAALQPWLALNPITIPIEQSRRVLFEAQWPQWDVMAQYSLVAVVVYLFGLWVFSKLKKGFADVL